jgi:hypothetical protein
MFSEVILVQIWTNFGKHILKFFSRQKYFEKCILKYLFKDKKRKIERYKRNMEVGREILKT